ncbi:hypothetical protein D3C78_1505660 [compost metagenome]
MHVTHAQSLRLVCVLRVGIHAAITGHYRLGQGAQEHAQDAHEADFTVRACARRLHQRLDHLRGARAGHQRLGEQRVDVGIGRVGRLAQCLEVLPEGVQPLLVALILQLAVKRLGRYFGGR